VNDSADAALYEVRRKIYARSVSGWFANWRVALVIATQLIYYGLPWLHWNDRQAVLFDLAARKFYVFGAVFWPQDFIFLAALLVICALSLFLFTAVAGRLFCGYACPQTVYTEIFMWLERVIEGDRMKRMRLDASPFGLRKLSIKTAKHAAWIAVAAITGFTFVGYFTDIHTLVSKLTTFSLGPWETFWIGFYGFATYGNAGWMREQVCKYMCPYARFQGVMFDPDTLVISYDTARGEPRGKRGRSVDPKSKGLGDCVDCGICVQVCPVGIDIRRGLQYECTGCAACIDGCNQVMDKLGYAPGLIRYSSENALKLGPHANIRHRVLRPRVVVYASLLMVICAVFVTGLYLRTPLKVDVIRDRGTLMRETGEGLIENVYRLQIMNIDEKPHRYAITASGLEGITVVAKQPVEIAAAHGEAVPIALRVDPTRVGAGSHTILITVQDVDRPDVRADEKSRFIVR
jgi:cytochrome c oxidase accessory protein FixG